MAKIVKGLDKAGKDGGKKRERSKKELFVSKRVILCVVCVVVALVLAFGLLPRLSKLIFPQDKNTLIMTENVTAGTIITADMLEAAVVTDLPLSDGYIENIDDAVGKYALTDLQMGDYITTAKVGSELPFANAFIYELKDGEEAISITIKSVAAGVANKVRAGDIVRVYATFPSAIGDDEELEAQTFGWLQYVRVLSVAAGEAAEAGDEDGDGEIDDISVVTLLANAEQAKLLAGLEAEATIHLAIIERGDEERALKLLNQQAAVGNVVSTPVVEAPIIDEVATND